MKPSEMSPLEWQRWNSENQIIKQIERSQSMPTLSQPQAPSRPSGQPQQYFTPGGFREARQEAIAGIFAPVMYACFMAAARKGATYPKAMLHAMDMVWRWKTLAFTLLYWVVSGVCIWLWMGAEAQQGINTGFHTRLLVLHVALLLPAILIPYCQGIDASFFKQRALYHILRPVHAVLGWIPWFVLQTMVLLPLLFIIQYRW